MSHSSRVFVVIVAAGRGLRAGGGLPKQYRMLAGKTVLRRSIEAFTAHSGITGILTVIHPDDHALYEASVGDLPVFAPVHGGETRQDSVRAGLEALADEAPDLVLIHDAARCFISAAVIDRAIAAAHEHGAAIPALPVTDTVSRVDLDGRQHEVLDRAPLRAAQTPQAFRFGLIRSAHHAARGLALTDDAAVARNAGAEVFTFAGETANIKLTHEDDFAMAETRLAVPQETRTGQGYDVHAFGEGDHVMLGGVRIPHSQGVVAHSDGDVLLHAATDAVLGALADGDIGTHFPPSDPQWKGVSSDRFLAHACALLAKRGGKLVHLDLTLVCEAPRIGPHRDAIRARVAEIAGISASRVGLKATTSEKMGFTGRKEGLAALALATLTVPAED